jgi:hypothetical protein
MVKKYVFIPRSFLVINVCNQGKTLCSPCISILLAVLALPWVLLPSDLRNRDRGPESDERTLHTRNVSLFSSNNFPCPPPFSGSYFLSLSRKGCPITLQYSVILHGVNIEWYYTGFITYFYWKRFYYHVLFVCRIFPQLPCSIMILT